MTQTVMSVNDLVRAAKGAAGTLTAEEVQLAQEQGATLIDVREPPETKNGRIRGAHTIPRGTLEFKVGDVTEDHDTRIVTYCSAGSRAALAAAALRQLGYAGATASDAGYDDLVRQGLAVEAPNAD